MGNRRDRVGFVWESLIVVLTACSLWILTGCGKSGSKTGETEATTADVEEVPSDAAPEDPIAARLAEPLAPVPPMPPRPVIEPLPPPPSPLSAQERRERLDALRERIAVIGERSQTLRRDLDAARKENPEGDFSEREAAMAALRREAIPLIYERATLARALEEQDEARKSEPEADARPDLEP